MGDLYWFANQVNVQGNMDINGELTADIIINSGYTFDVYGIHPGGENPEVWTPIGSGDKHTPAHSTGRDTRYRACCKR